ncbi:trimeric intracellular cation channel family protein [Neisseria perflava]|uniref:trimeric intracellular cation channel family protein n=1 Tax=Neisseria perflava TaxID=33053 RepID=UPI0020A1DF72
MTATDIISDIGTVAFAFSGYLVGVRKRLDLLGTWIAALLTAIGGGMIRDVLIGRTPAVFMENGSLLFAAGTVIIAWALRLQNNQRRFLSEAFVWADSLGLVAFTITGAQIGMYYGLNLFGVIVAGFITAVGGGIVRDILVNDVPVIMRQDIYGAVAVVIAFLMYLLDQIESINPYTLNLLFIAGYVLRMMAYKRKWALPKF